MKREDKQIYLNSQEKRKIHFEKKYLGDKARYIRLDFLENFTGTYYIIKNIKFYAFDEIDDS